MTQTEFVAGEASSRLNDHLAAAPAQRRGTSKAVPGAQCAVVETAREVVVPGAAFVTAAAVPATAVAAAGVLVAAGAAGAREAAVAWADAAAVPTALEAAAPVAVAIVATVLVWGAVTVTAAGGAVLGVTVPPRSVPAARAGGRTTRDRLPALKTAARASTGRPRLSCDRFATL